ncbi:hypothetical protein KKA47_05715 [bacterium]|nr:hypothetical protein [bacterium]
MKTGGEELNIAKMGFGLNYLDLNGNNQHDVEEAAFRATDGIYVYLPASESVYNSNKRCLKLAKDFDSFRVKHFANFHKEFDRLSQSGRATFDVDGTKNSEIRYEDSEIKKVSFRKIDGCVESLGAEMLVVDYLVEINFSEDMFENGIVRFFKEDGPTTNIPDR